MEFLIQIFGFLLIWIAVDIGRKPDSKVELLSWNFLIQVILIGLGVVLASYTLSK